MEITLLQPSKMPIKYNRGLALVCLGFATLLSAMCAGCHSYDYDLYYDDLTVFGQASRASIRVEGSEQLARVFLKLPSGVTKRCSEVSRNDIAPLFPHPSQVTVDGTTTIYGEYSYHVAFQFNGNTLEMLEIGGGRRFGLGRSAQGPFVTEPFDTSSDSRIQEVFGVPTRTIWRKRPGL